MSEQPKALVLFTERGMVPQDMDGLQRMSAMIAASPFAPSSFKDAASIAVAIDFGASVGLRPMQALQNIAVINGKPCLYGDGLIGVVRGSGLCVWIKEGVEGTGNNAVGWCETLRQGEPEPIRRTFSYQDAVTAGLWGKTGPWKQYPSRMLMLRARGFCLRDAYADALKGFIAYEEASDIPAERAAAMDSRIVDTTSTVIDEAAPTEIVVQDLPPLDIGEIDAAADGTMFGGKP